MSARNIRLGLAGLNQTPLDWDGNVERIKKACLEARQAEVDILCLPELAITGYGCEDAFYQPHVIDYTMSILLALAADTAEHVVLVGIPFNFHGELFNGVAVLNRGRVTGIVPKTHLAREGIHYEPRWFRPWPYGEMAKLEIGGANVPVGPMTLAVTGGFRFAVEICEDCWVPDDRRPCKLYDGVHFVFNASASHFSMHKVHERDRILTSTTKTWNFGYGYANLVGCESGRAIYDGELLFARKGAITARSSRLYLDDVRLLTQDFPFEPLPAQPQDVPVVIDLEEGKRKGAPKGQLYRQAEKPEDEFVLAATLALFDYMRKSRARGFVLSLSGGVDSSTVAALVWLLAHRLLRELDRHELKRKLAYFSGLNLDVEDPKQLVNQLLLTAYQATRNSGEVTRRAASELAKAIGAKHLELDVDDLVQGYTGMIAKALGRALSWDYDDIALQNIQARTRGPGVWMLANIRGSLLLTTSNRSEAAVGYATMDGDTAGGLAPIAGVEKTFLKDWLLYLEKNGVYGFPTLPELALVNRQEPTAELRPQGKAQQDEKDLMPYAILDALEEYVIGERRKPLKAFQALLERFQAQFSPAQLLEWTISFARLFAVNQWKRERFAPAFHLDDRNLDPKTWARYPILSGCFAKEIEELREWYQQHLAAGGAR